MSEADNRRPLGLRETRVASAAAARLARLGVRANAVSAASMVFALAAAAALVAASMTTGIAAAALMVAVAVGIGLRLLANLLDGMIAVEHGDASPTGPLWNELPDRGSDVAILVAAGYAARGLAGPSLLGDAALVAGWLAAVSAIATAYARELGRALGQPADFCGPFAKQQRMAVVAAGALLSACEPAWGGNGEALSAAIIVVAGGTLLTLWRRIARLAARLRAG